MPRIVLAWITAAVCLAAGGCASSGPKPPTTTFEVTDADYQIAFAAAKDVLRDAGFVLDRVDASRGIITTLERGSSGYATPWIDHATTPGDSASAVLHRERRLAAVHFQRTTDDPEAPIRAEVEVTIQRLGAPGRQPQPASIRILTRWSEGTRSDAPNTPFDTISERPDPKLAARLARQIETRIAQPPHSGVDDDTPTG